MVDVTIRDSSTGAAARDSSDVRPRSSDHFCNPPGVQNQVWPQRRIEQRKHHVEIVYPPGITSVGERFAKVLAFYTFFRLPIVQFRPYPQLRSATYLAQPDHLRRSSP
jgi:hypothetical protein